MKSQKDWKIKALNLLYYTDVLENALKHLIAMNFAMNIQKVQISYGYQ